MRLLNFKIGDDFISVEKDNVCYDLHSNFDFIGYNYTVTTKEFQIIFKKGLGEWVLGDGPENLIFKFAGVVFLKIKESDSIADPHDEKCLNDIGFSTADVRNDMESFLATNDFNDLYDMIFIFQSGQAIKIHSQEVLIEAF